MQHRGVWVIAHGSSNSDWVERVDQAVTAVQLELPIVTSFLEMVKDRAIPDGIRTLEEQGVTEVIVVPLFVSSGSTHIEEISYLLGLNKNPQFAIHQEPFRMDLNLRLCQAMDDHPLITRILMERLQEMSTDPKKEAVLLVGHGSQPERFKQMWKQGMEGLASQLREQLPFAQICYAMMNPDSLRKHLQELSSNYRVLVLPLFLSEGYFTKKVIPSKIEGIDCVYTGKTYLPSPFISRWIEAVVKEKEE